MRKVTRLFNLKLTILLIFLAGLNLAVHKTHEDSSDLCEFICKVVAQAVRDRGTVVSFQPEALKLNRGQTGSATASSARLTDEAEPVEAVWSLSRLPSSKFFEEPSVAGGPAPSAEVSVQAKHEFGATYFPALGEISFVGVRAEPTNAELVFDTGELKVAVNAPRFRETRLGVGSSSPSSVLELTDTDSRVDDVWNFELAVQHSDFIRQHFQVSLGAVQTVPDGAGGPTFRATLTFAKIADPPPWFVSRSVRTGSCFSSVSYTVTAVRVRDSTTVSHGGSRAVFFDCPPGA